MPGKGLIPFQPDWCQQQLLLDNSRYRHLNKGRQMGFTTTFAVEAVQAFIYTPQAEIVVLSKSEKEAKKFLDKFYVAYHSIKDIDPHCPKLITENTKNVEGANGSTVDVLTSSKGAGRSFSVTDLYMDEMAHTMYADDIYQGAIPTISVTGGRVTLFSTPKGRANKFAEIGEDPEDAGYSGHEYPWWFSRLHNDYYKEFMEAHFNGGEIDKKTVVDRARQRPRYKSLRQSFKGSFLAFQQEYECRYDASTNSVYSGRQIESLFKPWTRFNMAEDEDYPHTEEIWSAPAKKNREYVTFYDLGRKRDATVGVTFDVTEDPAVMVEYKRLPPGQSDWAIIKLAIQDTYDKFKPEMYHDSTGVGDAVSDMIEHISEPFLISDTNARTGVKYNMIENSRRAADDGVVIMPKIKQLLKEFKSYEWDDKHIVQDSVIAVAGAIYQFYQPEEVVSEIDKDFSYTGVQ